MVSCPPYLAHFLVHLHFDMIKPIFYLLLVINFSSTLQQYLLFNFCSKLRDENCQGLLKSYSPTVTYDKIFVYDFCVL